MISANAAPYLGTVGSKQSLEERKGKGKAKERVPSLFCSVSCGNSFGCVHLRGDELRLAK